MNKKQTYNEDLLKISKPYEDYTKDEIATMCDIAIKEHNNGTTIPSNEVEETLKNKINSKVN